MHRLTTDISTSWPETITLLLRRQHSVVWRRNGADTCKVLRLLFPWSATFERSELSLSFAESIFTQAIWTCAILPPPSERPPRRLSYATRLSSGSIEKARYSGWS